MSCDIGILMDADLQDPPEIIYEFINKIKEGYNVVYAIRKNRKENFIKKICYFVFYRFNSFGGITQEGVGRIHIDIAPMPVDQRYLVQRR